VKTLREYFQNEAHFTATNVVSSKSLVLYIILVQIDDRQKHLLHNSFSTTGNKTVKTIRQNYDPYNTRSGCIRSGYFSIFDSRN